MPLGDGTGPEGLGPMTGRGAGYCAGSNSPGYVNNAPRRGQGRGRGLGCGRGRNVGRRGVDRRVINGGASPTNNSNVDQTEAEVNYLQQEKKVLENE